QIPVSIWVYRFDASLLISSKGYEGIRKCLTQRRRQVNIKRHVMTEGRPAPVGLRSPRIKSRAFVIDFPKKVLVVRARQDQRVTILSRYGGGKFYCGIPVPVPSAATPNDREVAACRAAPLLG